MKKPPVRFRSARSLLRPVVSRLRAWASTPEWLVHDTTAAGTGAGSVVAVLADSGVGSELRAIIRACRGTVHVVAAESKPVWSLKASKAHFHAATNLDELNWVLKLNGPVDVLVNLMTKTATGHEKDWDRLFFNVRKGGTYVIPRDRIARDAEPGVFQRLAAVAAAQSHTPEAIQKLPASIRSFTSAVGSVSMDEFAIRVSKADQHFVKVRDADGSRVLAVRGRTLEVRDLVTLPGQVFEHRGDIVTHEAGVPITHLDTCFSVPPLKLRHYTGPIGMVSNALLFSEEAILPDSFRHHRTPGLINPALTNVNRDFALIPDRVWPHARRDGSFYHLDSENSGHFGHLVTEVMSRLWGWDEAKRDCPELKAIFRIRYPNERDPILERRLFAAYGIDENAITWISEPTWIDSIYAATPMWHNAAPHYVHPDLQAVWQRVSDGLVRHSPRQVPAADRLFISRQDTTSNRACRNTRDVERLFSRHGFTVIYPEELDLAQQAHLVREARVVAGFGGSGLFNVFNSRALEHLIVLNHEAYTARNEHLYAAVLGCTEHYFWSPSDVAHPPGGWSDEAYYSGWDFDFNRNASALTALLASV